MPQPEERFEDENSIGRIVANLVIKIVDWKMKKGCKVITLFDDAQNFSVDSWICFWALQNCE